MSWHFFLQVNPPTLNSFTKDYVRSMYAFLGESVENMRINAGQEQVKDNNMEDNVPYDLLEQSYLEGTKKAGPVAKKTSTRVGGSGKG
uniref:Phage portal protein n=1 Tax=Steinernema glaseri TaxID=37863 RepID=A0A1I8AJU4_9BILA